MLNVNNQKNEVFIQNDSDKNIKIDNIEKTDDDIIVNPYKEDKKNIEISIKKSGSAPTAINFDMEDKEINSLINKLMNSELKPEDIQKFISDINDNTIKAILDAIDKTIENARKIMEQNKIHYEKVEKPKLELIKKLLHQELITKENQIKNIL